MAWLIADIVPAKSAPVRAALLARRRPEMYGSAGPAPRADRCCATATPRHVKLLVEGGDLDEAGET